VLGPLGHQDVQTTLSYTCVLIRWERDVHGPLGRLRGRVCGKTLGIIPAGPH